MGTRHLVEAAQERGVDGTACLAGTGLRVRDLARGEATVAAWQEVMVADNLARLVGDGPVIGPELGRRLPLAAYGPPATALRAARHVGDVLEICQRYAALLPGLTRASLTMDGRDPVVTITFDGRRLAGPGHRILLERDVVAGHLAVSELVGRPIPVLRLLLPRRPEDLEPWMARFGVPPGESGSGIAVLHLDGRGFDGLLPGADPDRLRSALAECQRLLAARRSEATATHQVLVRLWGAAPRLPDLEALADSLLTTSRTLRRRLAVEGTSYQKLADTVRLSIATRRLDGGIGRVAETAHYLGYADTAAFSNAFRRWTGVGPRDWSRQRAGSNHFGQRSLHEPDGKPDVGRLRPTRRTA